MTPLLKPEVVLRRDRRKARNLLPTKAFHFPTGFDRQTDVLWRHPRAAGAEKVTQGGSHAGPVCERAAVAGSRNRNVLSLSSAL